MEALLFARGVRVTSEAIRKWCRKFGRPYANQRRRRRSIIGLIRIREIFSWLAASGEPSLIGQI